MSNRRWTKILVVCWMVLVAGISIRDFARESAPASRWLNVTEMHVSDSWEGEPPFMSVNRVIRRPFRGEWIATIRVVSDGSNAAICPPAHGRASYAIDARYPPNLTLDWWIQPEKCSLKPGRYRLDTEWTILPHDGSPAKTVTAISNIFEVHALPEAIKALRTRPSP